MSADYISQKLEEFQPNLDGPYYCCAIFEALPQKSEDGTSMPLDALFIFFPVFNCQRYNNINESR